MKRNNETYLKGRTQSFADAFNGLPHIFKESNFKIHIAIATICSALAFYLNFSKYEWIVLILCIIFIFVLEGLNTAIEHIVDFISPGFHEKAGRIKDIASASVLMGAFGVAIVGLILFLPKFLL